jgi:protein-tyrosine phosphatase
MFKNILVLCTGNICRSPMAEALLRQRLGKPEVQVGSAGTAALVGYPADPLAVEVAGRSGLDLSQHRGRQVVTPLLTASDLVLVMTRAHADWVHERVPLLRGRVQLLGRWRPEPDIPDPYGESRETFEQVFAQIGECVADWLPKLA